MNNFNIQCVSICNLMIYADDVILCAYSKTKPLSAYGVSLMSGLILLNGSFKVCIAYAWDGLLYIPFLISSLFVANQIKKMWQWLRWSHLDTKVTFQTHVSTLTIHLNDHAKMRSPHVTYPDSGGSTNVWTSYHYALTIRAQISTN